MAAVLSSLLCAVPNLDWPLPPPHAHPDGFVCRFWQWAQHGQVSA